MNFCFWGGRDDKSAYGNERVRNRGGPAGTSGDRPVDSGGAVGCRHVGCDRRPGKRVRQPRRVPERVGPGGYGNLRRPDAPSPRPVAVAARQGTYRPGESGFEGCLRDLEQPALC